MQFGFARISVTNIKRSHIGMEFNLPNAQGFTKAKLLDYNPDCTIELSPKRASALLLVSSKIAGGWQTVCQPMEEPLVLPLNEEGGIETIIIGFLP